MINSDINNGGIYKAYILSESDDIKIYIPGLYNDFEDCPINKDDSLNMKIFQQLKKVLPTPLWCLPNLEAKQFEQVHPCWVVFENGDSKRPIIMGYLGKGIKYNAGSNGIIQGDENYNPDDETTNEDNNTDKNNQYKDSLTISGSGWAWPVPGYNKISSPYGPRDSGYHYGIDITGNTRGEILGAEIIATKSGIIRTNAYNKSGYGWWVAIEHDNGTYSRYGHMNKQSKLPGGTKVNQGDVIGYVGSTGRSTGPHLHFEIRPNNKPDNPLNYVIKPT